MSASFLTSGSKEILSGYSQCRHFKGKGKVETVGTIPDITIYPEFWSREAIFVAKVS